MKRIDEIETAELFDAVIKKRSIFNFINALKIKYSSLELSSKDERSLLTWSVLANDAKSVEYLLSNDLDVNKKDNKGMAPLHYACQEYYFNILKILLDNNADLEVKDNFGNTPLNNAVYHYKDDGEVIKYLLKKGANANNKNNYGVSPKDLANDIGNTDVKKFFK